MLPVAVGGALAAILIALFAYVAISSNSSSAKPAASVSQQYGCSQPEMTTETHYHVHLTFYVGGVPPAGQEDPIPAQVGIQNSGFCWLHTHDGSGIIHIEAPFAKTPKNGFTLGDFLKVWRLSNPDATLAAGAGQKEVVYVNGQEYNGSPASVTLKSREDIVIEILASDQSPTTPPAYQWPQGFGQ